MKITVFPSRASGRVTAPPSKSVAHRLLIAAGLADGRSVIENVSFSEDILATLDCLSALGATVTPNGNTVTVDGIGGRVTPRDPLNCRESGSTLRFFIPIAAISREITTLIGADRLFERPLGVYETIFAEQGLPFHKEKNTLTLAGKLKSGAYTVKGNISSQFITGLLFALPLTSGDSTVTLLPPIESRSYIDITLDTLRTFGITAGWQNETTLAIKGNQAYTPRHTTVEGDYSNAAFTEALRLLGDGVTTSGLSPSTSKQGDRIFYRYFDALAQGAPTLSLADCPDLAPILMTLAALKNGATFTDTARLAIKESNRGEAMAKELAKCGVVCQVHENSITVERSTPRTPSVALSGHNDHRIVMALTVLLTRLGGTITGAQAVRKSYPDFFDVLRTLGILIKEDNEL